MSPSFPVGTFTGFERGVQARVSERSIVPESNWYNLFQDIFIFHFY